MRKYVINMYERDFMSCVAGQLYEQAPNHKPRKIEIIMDKAQKLFREYPTHAMIFGNTHGISMEEKDVYNFFDTLLKSIPEFNELNLSQNEFDKNITVDDPNRPPFAVTSIYDIRSEDSWKSDFIDLTAFVQNVTHRFLKYKETSNNCFLCIHQSENSSALSPGDDEVCRSCLLNPYLKNHFKSDRKPKGKYTISCNYDCFKGCYICCEECNAKDTCSMHCDSTPDKCNNHI